MYWLFPGGKLLLHTINSCWKAIVYTQYFPVGFLNKHLIVYTRDKNINCPIGEFNVRTTRSGMFTSYEDTDFSQDPCWEWLWHTIIPVGKIVAQE
jgi:hypothetical protein